MAENIEKLRMVTNGNILNNKVQRLSNNGVRLSRWKKVKPYYGL